jgi:hypothetical protein
MAESKLTGRMERISIVSSDKELIDGLCAQYQAHKYRRKPYKNPKVEVWQPDMFNDKQ